MTTIFLRARCFNDLKRKQEKDSMEIKTMPYLMDGKTSRSFATTRATTLSSSNLEIGVCCRDTKKSAGTRSFKLEIISSRAFDDVAISKSAVFCILITRKEIRCCREHFTQQTGECSHSLVASKVVGGESRKG